MLENPMVTGQSFEESYATPEGQCVECRDFVFQGYEGVLFEDELFCCTSCLESHLKKVGAIQEI